MLWGEEGTTGEGLRKICYAWERGQGKGLMSNGYEVRGCRERGYWGLLGMEFERGY